MWEYLRGKAQAGKICNFHLTATLAVVYCPLKQRAIVEVVEMSREYPYGKAHHEKYPYVAKMVELFSEYIDRIEATNRTVLTDHRIHNLLIELQSEACTLIDEIYKEVKVKSIHGASLPAPKRSSPRRYSSRGSIVQGKNCEICFEARAVDVCHIIPREEGGRNEADNYVFLCPTHHFFFDQARLTTQEFERIPMDGKAEDSAAYFLNIRKPMHEMYWRYETNKFRGCNCGSKDFTYDTDRNGNFVQVCLRCLSCGEKWVNLWTETHPITKASVEAFDLFGPEISAKEKERLFRDAERKVRDWINSNLVG